MQPVDLKKGTTVRHPSRGTGKIATLIYSPLKKDIPIKAWVAFELCGYSKTTQKFVCFVDDLTVVPPPVAKPTLSVVPAEHPQVVA